MPPDPERIAEVTRWLARAGDDLRAAEVDLAATPPLVEDAVFHCQQAVEKALKAFLTFHGRAFRKTHDLVELGTTCAAVEPALEPLLRRAAPLTEYAWAYRYPADVEPPTPEHVSEELALAREIRAAIVARVSG